ncbi:hypothetical protein DFS34DRAFT_626666 [Phlyctochytrium arcticum]|nr:hypothetical protein DFS34DRAFT_626666 [Phlyctochytrium arcticum]
MTGKVLASRNASFPVSSRTNSDPSIPTQDSIRDPSCIKLGNRLKDDVAASGHIMKRSSSTSVVTSTSTLLASVKDIPWKEAFWAGLGGGQDWIEQTDFERTSSWLDTRSLNHPVTLTRMRTPTRPFTTMASFQTFLGSEESVAHTVLTEKLACVALIEVGKLHRDQPLPKPQPRKAPEVADWNAMNESDDDHISSSPELELREQEAGGMVGMPREADSANSDGASAMLPDLSNLTITQDEFYHDHPYQLSPQLLQTSPTLPRQHTLHPRRSHIPNRTSSDTALEGEILVIIPHASDASGRTQSCHSEFRLSGRIGRVGVDVPSWAATHLNNWNKSLESVSSGPPIPPLLEEGVEHLWLDVDEVVYTYPGGRQWWRLKVPSRTWGRSCGVEWERVE